MIPLERGGGDPRVRVGHAHLKVADLERSLAFWHGVIGLSIMQRMEDFGVFLSADDYHHDLALNTRFSEGGQAPAKGTTGLFHVAFLYPDRPALAQVVKRVRAAGIPIDGASDHGVSEAIYLRDPDENGVELYRDRDRAEWPRDEAGRVAMYSEPLDLEALLREAVE